MNLSKHPHDDAASPLRRGRLDGAALVTARQPCPECGASLYRWRSLALDGEDTDPRGACTNPKCDFEY